MYKVEELKTKDQGELLRMVSELKGKLLALRFENATGQLKESHLMKNTRKDIARIFTIIKERQIALQANPDFFHAKPVPLKKFGAKKVVLDLGEIRSTSNVKPIIVGETKIDEITKSRKDNVKNVEVKKSKVILTSSDEKITPIKIEEEVIAKTVKVNINKNIDVTPVFEGESKLDSKNNRTITLREVEVVNGESSVKDFSKQLKKVEQVEKILKETNKKIINNKETLVVEKITIIENIDKLTVPQLKAKLKELEIKVKSTHKKADLLELLSNHLEKEGKE